MNSRRTFLFTLLILSWSIPSSLILGLFPRNDNDGNRRQRWHMSTSRWKRDWDFTIESIKGKRSRMGGSRERRSTLRQRISSGDPLLDGCRLPSSHPLVRYLLRNLIGLAYTTHITYSAIIPIRLNCLSTNK